MSFLFWNCRGLGGPLTVPVLGDLIRARNPNLVFLSETRSLQAKVESLKRRWNLFGVSVDRVGQAGGLALLWRKDVRVDLISFSSQHIDVEVMLPGMSQKWRCTGFYGFADQNLRYRSWQLLRTLAARSDLPWIVGGDFNEILSQFEKEGGVHRSDQYIDNFRTALNDCSLSDLGFEGHPFTWSNYREAPFTIRCRLDRVCATTSWLQLFPDSFVEHLNYPGSDHIPLLLHVKRSGKAIGGNKRRPWRFEAHWIRRTECEAIIREAWDNQLASDNFERLFQSIKECRLGLRGMVKSGGETPKVRIQKLRERLDKLTKSVITRQSKEEMANIRMELEHVYMDEEIYWRQRGKNLWAQEGDRNTRFFHAKASKRKKENTITGLFGSDGVWKEKAEEIEQIIVEYFGDLFQTSQPASGIIDEILRSVTPGVTPEMNQLLTAPYTSDEVTQAISQFSPLKSPGPDGLPAVFFHKFWRVIGSSVSSCVIDFLNLRRLPRVLNFTYIVLIPKVTNPTRITEFRPISLCNVIYKIGSKMIANRMKICLDSIISPTQSAFVPKRLITDNVLVAFEVNHFLKCKDRGKQYMALKLDISKAYDRIEWIFLKRILLKLGFAESFVSSIMMCISSVSYSFLLNGKQFGAIQPQRGLRQGDPLSPYLFICCAEGFIRMVDEAVREGRLHGVKVAPSAPVISNLCFADDTVIYCQASVQEASEITHILERYALASGQIINLEKSTMMFSRGTSQVDRDSIQQLLGIQVVEKFEKYLGMPAVVGRSRKEVFGFLSDRVWERISRWSDRDFSMAGREVLIKAVLQAIPTYAMSCFKLPTSLLEILEGMVRRFWWSGGGDRKINWLSWRMLCRTKSCGGLGFRDLESFNLAMLAKQAWRLLTSPTTLLARVLKAKYYPDESFYSAGIGTRPSYTWRSILQARECLVPGLRSRIGNGLSTSIWDDNWLLSPSNGKVLTTRPADPTCPDRVGDLIDWASWTWNVDLISQIFWPVDAFQILQVPFGAPDSEDQLVWAFSKTGAFTVRSCYHSIVSGKIQEAAENTTLHNTVDKVWDWIWRLKIPPKVRTFVWRGCHDIIPTRVALVRRKVGTDPFCPFCCYQIETSCHIVFGCEFFKDVWKQSELPIPSDFGPGNFADGIRILRACLDDDQFGFACILCWNIWNYRNETIHGNENGDRDLLVSRSKNYQASFRSAKFNFPVVRGTTGATIWSPPLAPFVRVNFDAALLDSGFYQVAAVARGSDGRCLRWRARRIQGSPSPVIAEACAARLGIIMAQEMLWSHIELEGDCLQVVSAFKDLPNSGLRPFDAIISSCVGFINNFSSFRVSFTRRSGNVLAHALAHLVFHNSDVLEGFVLPADLAY